MAKRPFPAWLRAKIEAAELERAKRRALPAEYLTEPSLATRRKRAQQVYDAAVTSHLEDMPPF
jgi:hypothetical protein